MSDHNWQALYYREKTRAEAAEADRDELKARMASIIALDVALSETEAERDRWRAVACNVKDGTSDYRESELRDAFAALQKDRDAWAARVLAAEAEVARLREQMIRACQFLPMTRVLATEKDYRDDHPSLAGHILRAALAAPTEEGT